MLRRNTLTTLLFLICIILSVLVSPRPGETAANLRRVTQTSEDAISLNPSLSGDGSHLVFESTADLSHSGSGDGFHALDVTLSPETANFVEIGRTRIIAPGISDNGSAIVFSSTEDLTGQNKDRNSEIFLQTPAGLQQVTNTAPNSPATRTLDGSFQPGISDDARTVAFSSNRNLTGNNNDLNFEVFTFDTVTQTFAQLTDTTEIFGSIEAKISGDGSHIVYIRENAPLQGSNRELVLFDLYRREAKTIVHNLPGLALTYGQALSDNGLRVVYSTDTGEHQSQVFLFDESANTSRQITLLGTRASDVPLNASISGDGKRIAFATRRRVLSATDGSVELYVFDLPSAQFSQITNAPATASAEVVSSLNDDGSLVAFNFPRVLSGDVTSTTTSNNSEIYLAVVPARAAFGQLTLQNAASLGHDPSAPTTLPRSGLVRGTGQALSQEMRHGSRSPNGAFPFELAGTSVNVNGVPAQILYVSQTEVTFVIPDETPSGLNEIAVRNTDGFESRSAVLTDSVSPGLFTTDGTGQGDGIILNADTLAPGPFDPTNGRLRLTVFATGVRNARNVSADIGAEPVVVENVLPSPDLPGLDEVHLLVPEALRGAGSVNLTITADGRQSNVVTLDLAGSALRDIVINEFLADPPDGLAGDANQDGTRSASNDEFIELVNSTVRDLDLTGYVISTRAPDTNSEVIRHRFAAHTTVPAGTAIVVFGGGNPNTNNPAFGGARVLKASSGSLSFTNSGAVIALRDPSGALVAFVAYGGTTQLRGDQNQSLTRSLDITGALILHTLAPGSLMHPFSPGTRVSGEPFQPAPVIVRIEVEPRSATLAEGRTQLFVARAFGEAEEPLSDVIFDWKSSSTGVAEIDQSGLATAVHVGSALITASARNVTSAPSLLIVPAPSPSPSPVSTPSPSPSPSPGSSPTPVPSPSPSPSPTVVTSVLISEFRFRGPAGASDEFIELYNNSDLPVDISGWKIKGSSSTGAISTRLAISAGRIIPARGHFLATNTGSYSGTVVGDQTYTNGFADDGGIGLTLANDFVVDQVGLSSGSSFGEGSRLTPLAGDLDRSYERKPGRSLGSTEDTNDNLNDFQLAAPGDPQNSESLPTPGPSPSPTPTPSPSPTPVPTPTPSPSPSPTPVPTPTPSPLPSPSPSPTASPTPTPLPTILISEFRTRGPNGASDEFIEIYNNMDFAVALAGWKVKGSSSSGTIATRATIPNGVVIQPFGHYLLANAAGYGGLIAADQTYSSGIADDGGIAITTSADQIVDEAGMSSGSAFREGTPLSPQSGSDNQSYERKPGGLLGSGSDTNDNAADFQRLSPSDPQNLASSPVPGPSPSPTPSPSASPTPSPSPMESPSPSPTSTPSPTPTPSPSPSPGSNPNVVISQIYGGGGNSGAPFRNDFIEVFNRGTEAINLAGWSVQYSSATSGSWTVTPLNNVTLAPGQYYLVQEGSAGSVGQPLPPADSIGTINLAATSGKVALVNNTASLSGTCPTSTTIVDLVGYGTTASCFEGLSPAPAPNNTTAIQRAASGCLDTQNNGIDFSSTPPNPRNTSATLHPCSTARLVNVSQRWMFFIDLLFRVSFYEMDLCAVKTPVFATSDERSLSPCFLDSS